jgi:hypothetical protein
MCHGTVINRVVWANTARTGAQIVYSLESAKPRYSCIEGWTGGGEGNIANNPLFLDADGPDNDTKTYADDHYHLRPPARPSESARRKKTTHTRRVAGSQPPDVTGGPRNPFPQYLPDKVRPDRSEVPNGHGADSPASKTS